MRGDAGPKILLLTLVALFGGFAWLTHHPEAEIVRRAESWPFVGPLASQFRQRFTVRRQYRGHRPATPSRELAHGVHVDGVDIGALFAIDLD